MFLGSDAYYRLCDKERNVSVEKSRNIAENILDNPISKAMASLKYQRYMYFLCKGNLFWVTTIPK